MLTRTVLLIFIFLFVGCGSDENRQYDLRYPATFTIANQSRSTISVESVYSDLAQDGGFVLNGGNIAAGEKLVLRVSEGNYDLLASGGFFIALSCDDRKIDVSGRELKVRKKGEWVLVVDLEKCPGALSG